MQPPADAAVAAPTPDPAFPAQHSSLWRNHSFLFLWAGQSVSVLGSQFSDVAVPLTAVLLLQMTPFQMGLLQAVRTLPALVLVLLAGVWVDRVRRRPVLIAADLGRAALLAAIPVLFLAGALRPEHLLAVMLAVGALTVLFDTAHGAYLPGLVSRAELTDANGKLVSSAQAAGVLGPSLAGAVVQAVSAPVAVAVDAFSFVLSAVLLWRIRAPEGVPAGAARGSAWTQAVEGMRFLVANRFLRLTTISFTLNNLAVSMYTAVYVLFVVDELAMPPAVLGLLFAALGVGALAGSLAAHRLVQRLGLGRMLVLAGALAALGFAAVPLAAVWRGAAVPLLLTGQVLQPFGFGCVIVAVASLWQAVTPNELLGRVGATRRLINLGVMPLGALVAGLIGAAVGLTPVFVLVVLAALGQTLACSPLVGLGDPAQAARPPPNQS
jgi:MFS family permease